MAFGAGKDDLKKKILSAVQNGDANQLEKCIDHGAQPHTEIDKETGDSNYIFTTSFATPDITRGQLPPARNAHHS